MDPLSVAGLGLGVISLSFQLFAGCIKGFMLLSTAQNLGKDSTTLICMLNLQEVQLTQWARLAGLLSGSNELDRRLNSTVVEAALRELESLLSDTEKLKKRYKLGLQIADDDVSPQPAVGALNAAISDDARRDILLRARLIQDRNAYPQRLRWATIDKSKFEDYVSQIRIFVQDLWRLLDPLRQDEMASGLQMVLSHVINMSYKVEELHALKDALEHSSMSSGSANFGSESASLASVATIKAIGMGMGATPSQTYPETSSLYTHQERQGKAAVKLVGGNIRDFAAVKGNSEMGMASYEGEAVFVEWKELPVYSRSKIMGRVQDLAILLGAPKHPNFRSLRCRGIASDAHTSRIACIFEWPLSSALQPPRPLRTAFGGSPSLTERLQLALSITESVRFFHMAGWLHKNLRSENILLFPSKEKNNSAGPSLNFPMLAGFSFSRLNSPSEVSEQPSADPQRDIYRHPEAMGEPSESFSAAKDVYALGTILLEIGEWRSLRSLVERVVDVGKGDVSLLQLAKIQPFLLDESAKGGLASLRFRMGNTYAAVTKMMLSGEIYESPAMTKEEGQIFAPNILDVAVRELSRCVI
ncbi:hypothetical protein G7Y79_00014g036210 [Physcia stellaris]|nr:hypothetical protein G7Y79_00014g036210 [Physcia stellaris]